MVKNQAGKIDYVSNAMYEKMYVFVEDILKMRNRCIKPYYINIPSRITFTQLMNSDNVKDMKNLASCIKSLFNWYNMYLFI